MATDYFDVYEQASAWATDKVRDARRHFDAKTPCDEWDVRTLMNHMLDTQRYFLSKAHGVDASPPAPEPPELLSDDPLSDFEQCRAEMLAAYREPDIRAKTGPALGIAFSDQLLHGWDLARATEQDATMPDGLAQVAYDTIHGQFTDEQRKGVFKPEIEVDAGASAQQKLLAYTGRVPA